MTQRLSRLPRRRALEAIALGAVLGAGVSQGPRAQVGQAAQPAAAAANPASEDSPFAFALIGDLPYSDLDEPRLAAMLTQIDAEPLALVVHVGDIKASREPCSNDLYQRRLKLLDASAHPLVLLPGDNEWTDCHRRSAGGFDPRERLEMLRKLFWFRPEPLGRNARSAVSSMAFERQMQMPENVRWKIGAVRFVTVHVVGSNNGLDEYPGSRDEFESRQKANQTWLFETLAMAEREQASALVIAAHGDLPKLMPYLHLPVQSGSDRILKAMNRKHTAAQYLRLIDRIRAARPDIVLTSDFIAGFPGETEADHQATLELIEAVGYGMAYSFRYSPRPGTPAAEKPELPDEVALGRLHDIQALITRQQRSVQDGMVGREVSVLYEKPGRMLGQMVGKSEYLHAVHVDDTSGQPGQLVRVKISASSANSLAGVRILA